MQSHHRRQRSVSAGSLCLQAAEGSATGTYRTPRGILLTMPSLAREGLEESIAELWKMVGQWPSSALIDWASRCVCLNLAHRCCRSRLLLIYGAEPCFLHLGTSSQKVASPTGHRGAAFQYGGLSSNRSQMLPSRMHTRREIRVLWPSCNAASVGDLLSFVKLPPAAEPSACMHFHL